jgi:hypothetical protein
VELRPQDSEPQPPQAGAKPPFVDTKVAEMSSAEPLQPPPEDPTPVKLASGLQEATDARIEADAKEAVAKIDRDRQKVEEEIQSLATDLMMIVGRHEEWVSWVRSRSGMEVKEDFYTEWEQSALLKLKWRIGQLRAAHDDLTDMIADTYGDMHAALGSRGEKREAHHVSMNRRSWQGREGVTEALKEGKALLDERLPDTSFEPESLTQEWYGTLNHREQVTFGYRNLKALRSDLNQVSIEIAKAAAAELAVNLVLAVAGGPIARGLLAVASKAYRGLKAAGSLVRAAVTGAEGASAVRRAASLARNARVAQELGELSSFAKRSVGGGRLVSEGRSGGRVVFAEGGATLGPSTGGVPRAGIYEFGGFRIPCGLHVACRGIGRGPRGGSRWHGDTSPDCGTRRRAA